MNNPLLDRDPTTKEILIGISGFAGTVCLAALYIIMASRIGATQLNTAILVVVGVLFAERVLIQWDAWKIMHEPPPLDEQAQKPWLTLDDYPIGIGDDERPIDPKSDEEIIETRYHPVIMLWPAMVFAMALIGMGMIAMNDDEQVKWTLAILLSVAFALMVGVPYLEAIRKLINDIRRMDNRKKVTRVAGALGLIVFLGLVYQQATARGVSFDWLWTSGRWAIEQIRGLAVFVTKTPLNLMMTVAVLALLKLIIQFVDRQINPLIIDGNNLVQRTGIIRRDPGIVPLAKVTNYSFSKWQKIPWGMLTVETAGQVEAIPTVHWMPRWFYEEFKAAVDKQQSGE